MKRVIVVKRVITRRPGPIKSLDRYAEKTLAMCAERWDAAADLDTAVRDNVAQGLAYLVWSAYDSISCSKGIGFSCDNYSASATFVSGATANWFREREFAEWFCIAAGELFHNQRPRLRAEWPATRRRLRSRKKAA